jgi:hypothetical protein
MGRLPAVPASHALVDTLLGDEARGRASSLSQALLGDTTEFALCPTDTSGLVALAGAVQHTFEHASPASVQRKNKTGWKLWTEFIRFVGGDTPALRPSHLASLPRERFLKAGFVMWARRKCKSSIPGRITVKPKTLRDHLYAVSRVHRQNNIEFNTAGTFKPVFDYLCREYSYVHGSEALIPRKREGFSRTQVLSILQGLQNLPLRSRRVPVVSFGSWVYWSLRAATALSAGGGFRLGEVGLDSNVEFNAMHMSRASLFFIIEGIIHRAPSRDLLLSMRRGAHVGVIACPCKNDQFGFHFMPFPLIFKFDPTDPESTGCILRDYALHCPVPATELRSTPMFTYGPGLEALRRDFLLKVLKAALLTFMEPSLCALYSWHSFRVGLACALRAAQAPDWVILALLRWRSASSIPGYGRINYGASEAWLDAAGQQGVDSRQTASLPGLHAAALVSLPNALKPGTYEFLSEAHSIASLDRDRILALASSLPATDDDEFMSELQGCDPLEETVDADISDEEHRE